MSEPPINIDGPVSGDAFTGGKRVIDTGGGDYNENPTIAAPAIGVAALHQLPAPPPDFVGRERELRELAQAVQARGVAISGLRGMGGVGKTALALKLAEQLTPRFPDAQYFIRLDGSSKTPLDPQEALAKVIRAYEPTAQLPDDLESRRAQYLSLLSGKRALVVLDDAYDAAQVLPLLPPAGCLLVVTSRQHFTLPGWEARHISLLSKAEARRLLRKIAPRIKGQADEIARLCGYHPLALRAAAGLLAARPDLEPDQFAKDLQAEQARLKLVGSRAEGAEIDVDALFNLSYAHLTPETAMVFRRLAVFPDDFDAQAEKVVCDDAGHARLTELMRFSLVEYSPKRYRLHDLVRDFARSRQSETERDDAQRRHAEYYSRILVTADILFQTGGESSIRGIAFFDAEQTNIFAGQGWAATHWRDDYLAASLVSNYAGAGLLLSLRQIPSERIGWIEVALAAMRFQGNRKAEAAHLLSLGMAHIELGETQQAAEYFENSLKISRELGDQMTLGQALNNIGLAFAKLKKSRQAIPYYEQALVIARKAGNRQGEGNALGNLGLAMTDLGVMEANSIYLKESLIYLQQSLGISLENGDRHGQGITLNALGVAYHMLGC